MDCAGLDIRLSLSAAFDTVAWATGRASDPLKTTSATAKGRDGLEAVLSRQRQRSRQGSNVLNRGEARQRPRQRGRGEAVKTRGKAEASQSENDVVCVILISCTMHM